MPIKKGDKVQLQGGQVMDVRAAGDNLAICEWREGASVKQEIFNVADLLPVVTQPAEQPHPARPPSA